LQFYSQSIYKKGRKEGADDIEKYMSVNLILKGRAEDCLGGAEGI